MNEMPSHLTFACFLKTKTNIIIQRNGFNCDA